MTSMDIDSPSSLSMAITPVMPADNNETPISDEQPNKRRRKKSIVWEHFTIETVDANCMRACCKQCNKSFAYITGSKLAGTSHLKRHIALGICPVSRQKNEGSPMTPGARTDPPKRRYRASPGFGSIPFDQERCNQEIAKMIIQHEYPLHIVEHPAFVDFVRTIQPQYKMVSFNTIQGECVAVYLREKQSLLNLISGIPGRVSLALDWATSNLNIGYAFLTGHFIDSDWNLHRRLLNVVMLPFPDSDYAFNQAVVSCLSDWHLESGLFSLTLDQSFSNETTIGNLRGLLSVKNPLMFNCQLLKGNCYAHVLSRLAQDALGAMVDVIRRIRESVKYVKTSETHHEKFAELRQRLQVPSTKDLVIDDRTKWNTTYHMLVAACELKEVFACLDTSDPVYEINPSMDDWKQVEILCTYLKLFYDAASILTAPTYPPANAFYHEVSKVQLELTHAAMSQDPFVCSFTKPLKEKFDQYWKDCFLVLAIAVIMDPRFKMKLVEFSFSKIFGEDAGMWIKIVDDGIHELFLEYLAPNYCVPTTFMEAEDVGITQSEILQDLPPQEAVQQEPHFQGVLQQESQVHEVPLEVVHPADVPSQEAVQQEPHFQGVPQQESQVQEVPLEEVRPADVPSQQVHSKGVTAQDVKPEEVIPEVHPKDETLQDVSHQVMQHQEVAQQDMQSQDVPVQEMQTQGLPLHEVDSQELQMKATATKELPVQAIDTRELPLQAMDTQELPVQAMDTQELPVQAIDTQEVPAQVMDTQEVPVQAIDAKELPVQAMDTQELPAQAMDTEEVPVLAMDPQELPVQAMDTQELPAQAMDTEEVPVLAMDPQELPVQAMDSQELPMKEMVGHVEDVHIQEAPPQEAHTKEVPIQEMDNQEETDTREALQQVVQTREVSQEVHAQEVLTEEVHAQEVLTQEVHTEEVQIKVASEETQHPEMVAKEMDHPEVVAEERHHPEEERSHPEVAAEGTHHPEVAAEETHYPEEAAEEMHHPEGAAQEMHHPEVAAQETQHPEVAAQVTQHPEVAAPEMHLPEAQTNEMHLPEAHTHDVLPPDVATQEVHSPDAQTKDMHPPEAQTADMYALDAQTHNVHPPEAPTEEVHPPEGQTEGRHSSDPHTEEMHCLEAQIQEMHPPEAQTQEMHPPEAHDLVVHPSGSHTKVVHPSGSHTKVVHPSGSHTQVVHPSGSQNQELHPLEPQNQEMHPLKTQVNNVDFQEAQNHDLHPQELQTHETDPQGVFSYEGYSQGLQTQEMHHQELSQEIRSYEPHHQELPLISIGDGLSDFEIYMSEIASSQYFKSELDQYLEESLLPRVQEFDVLGWWKLNKLKYPTLSKMAADILSIPVSTVAPDSVFDTRNKKLDRYQSSLRPVTLEALICAKDWLQYESSASSMELSNAIVKMEY